MATEVVYHFPDGEDPADTPTLGDRRVERAVIEVRDIAHAGSELSPMEQMRQQAEGAKVELPGETNTAVPGASTPGAGDARSTDAKTVKSSPRNKAVTTSEKADK